MNGDMNEKKKIIIVGAGPGGLTSAMLLGHKGFDVEVFEAKSSVGGRNGTIKEEGYSFDLGPTFLMMKFILDEMFTETGRKSEDYLKFTRLDPMYRLIFNEFTLDVTEDREEMKKRMNVIYPDSGNGVDEFLKKEAVRFEKIYACLKKDYSSFKDFFNPIFLRALPYIPFGTSLFDYLGNYFDQEKLRLCFTFQAKYLGMSPWECPGFFVILSYIEHAFGVYHVEGGLSKISDAMAKVAEEEGVKIHLNSPVKQLVIENKKVVGVELENGEKKFADEVVLNADFSYAMHHLLPQGTVKKWAPEKLAKKKYSCSTFMLYLGLDKIYTELPQHTIAFADDYHKNVDNIFKDFSLSDDMSVYIRNASVNDKTIAPEGKSNIYVLVPVPNNRAKVDWKKEEARYRELVLDTIIKKTPLKDIKEHIVFERVFTPDNWDQDLNVHLGATFNLAHTIDQMLYFRPHNKFEELDGLYLVGGGTHPGSGLPTIYESGRIAANLIDKKYKK